MEIIYAFLLLLSSIPVGYILKKLTKEEIKSGKIYFHKLWISCLILSFALLFVPFNNEIIKITSIFTLLFIANVAFINWK